MAMALRSLSASLLLSTILNFPSLAPAADVPTTCYVLSGQHIPVAGFRCDNSTTGHSSCCGMGAVCYSNGVCQQDNSGLQDYVRVGCTDPTWKDPACLDQCRSYRPGGRVGIRFCNGSITSTNQYCCDNGKFGPASFECCEHPHSIFAINPVATVLAQIPLMNPISSTSSPSSSTTASSSPSSITATSSSPTPTSPPTQSSSNRNSHSLSIGLGVGIPLAFIAFVLLAFSYRRCYRHKGPQQQQTPYAPLEAVGSIPRMQDANKGYYGSRTYASKPQELPADTITHELYANGGRS